VPFTVPFGLPSGDSCDNFNELAQALHADPTTALGVLRMGDLEAFLQAQGRSDLAGAARAVLKAADHERGLDDFLGRLPGTTLAPARLRVTPTVVELGTLKPGEAPRFELVLHNGGWGRVYGAEDCAGSPWWGLGDGPALRRKIFQFSKEIVLPVQVQSEYLRAQNKPQEAELRLESNGGQIAVTVRAMVPV